MTRLELPVTDAELADEYESGLNSYQLADKYGCSQSTVLARLKSANCEIRYSKITQRKKLPITNLRLKDKYKSGLTAQDLADKYECHPKTILKRLKSTNCKIKGSTVAVVLPLNELKRDYESGSTPQDLADKYGCGKTTIFRRLKSLGCKIRKGSNSRKYMPPHNKAELPITNDELQQEYESGRTTIELAKRYGCGRYTILNRLNSINTKMRVGGSNKLSLPINKLIEEYESGINSTELAKKYECSSAVIIRRLKGAGCEIRDQIGDNNMNWNEGSSFFPYCPKFNESFKESIRNKFDRKCFICGITEKEMQEDQRRRGKRIFKLSVHHVNYNKDCLCDGSDCEFVPLCSHHHTKTNNNREYWESTIMQKLNDLSNNDDGLRDLTIT